MSIQENNSSIYNYSNHKNRHIVIEASAGTGKTYTITEIISQMVENNIPIQKIAVCTFTEKAAAELQDRIRVKLEKNGTELSLKAVEELSTSEIGTIHQFCRSLIRNFAFQLGLSSEFTEIEDETEDMEIFFDSFWKRIEKDDSKELIDLIKEIGLKSLKLFCFNVYSNSQNKKIQSNEKISLQELDSLVQQVKNFLSTLNMSKETAKKAREIELLQNSNLEILEWTELTIKTLFTQEETIIKYLETRIDSAFKEALLNLLQTFSNYQNQDFINTLIQYGNLFIQDYSEYKIQKDSVSKNDLVWMSCDLVKSANVKKILQEKFTYIIIDECQDSNPSQVQFMTGIFAQKEKGLIFVGDSKQSIYRFLGSDLESYKNGVDSLENAVKLSLDTSYRSTKNLIDLHNKIFLDFETINGSYTNIKTCPERLENDLDQASLILLGVNPDFTQFKFETAKTMEEVKETIFDEIIQTIKKIIRNPNYKIFDKNTNEFRMIHYSDIAILGASNASLRFAVKQLSESQIPANLYKADNFYSDPIVESFVTLLFAIENPFDSFSLFKALASDLFLISDFELSKLSEENENSFLQPSSSSKINFIYSSLKKAHSDRYLKPIGTILLDIIHENNIFQILSTGFYGNRNLTNAYQLIDILNALQVEESLTFSQVVRKLRFRVAEEDNSTQIKLEADRKNESYESINCMTFHASKGLEFPVCVLFDLIRDRDSNNKSFFYTHDLKTDFFKVDFKLYEIMSPDFKMMKQQDKEEEEKEQERLLYVGITRAKDFLIIPFFAKDNTKPETKGLLAHLMKCFRAEKLTEYSNENLIDFSINEGLGNNRLEKTLISSVAENKEIKLLNLNLNFSNKNRGYRIQSFSSLHKKDLPKDIIDKAAIGKSKDIQVDETKNTSNQINRVENEGASFGLLCHQVLEIFPLDKLTLSGDEIKILVTEFVNNYYNEFNLKNNLNYTSDNAIEYIYSALIKEYPMDFENQKFSKIMDWKYFSRERSFYYSLNSKSIDLLVGIGDGLFEFQGKYFILDWKSNFFTDSEQLKTIVETMYREQYMIYSLNLLKNITPENSEIVWNAKFGGMLFIFIRETENRKGTVLIKPSFQELMDFKKGLE